MVQLTTKQRVFVVKSYHVTKSVKAVVQEAFRIRFADREPPTKRTFLKNVRKYEEQGSSLNMVEDFGQRLTFCRWFLVENS